MGSGAVRLTAFAAGTALAIGGCAAGRIENGVFRSSHYRVTVPTGWRVMADGRADLALTREAGPGAMLVNATCEGREPGRDPDVLMLHLLFGLRERRILDRQRETVGGRPADRALFEGLSADGPVRGEAYVLKNGECVYDLLYVAPPESFEAGRKDFRRFVESLGSP